MNDVPPSPWPAIGLPAQFMPTPLVWRFAKAQANGSGGAETIHVLIVDHAGGRSAYAFSAADLQRLAAQMVEQATGLTLASDMPANGHR